VWTYVQRTGELFDAHGELVATGYAGSQEWKNRPEADGIRSKGPLPRGCYAIGPPRATREHGPYVLRLTPDPANDMKQRAGFLMHGDSKQRPGTASSGCVILPRAVRERVWTSGDLALRVVAEQADV
jgi:hypothetical protein